MEYYLIQEKKGHPAICRNMQGIKLRVKRQTERQINTVRYHLYVESKKAELIKTV